MKMKFALLVCASVSQLLLSASFTPEEARRVYDESSSTLSQSSCKEIGDYVFMEVKWRVESDDSSEDCEAKELSALMDAIQRYVAPPVVACTNSPFSKALTTWLMPVAEFDVPKVASSVVKDEEMAGARRQVVAFDAQALRAAKAKAAKSAVNVNARSVEDWTDSLKSIVSDFKTPSEKRKFNVMLGCPIVDFVLCDEEYVPGQVNADETDVVAEVERLNNWQPAKDSVFASHPKVLWSSYKGEGSKLFYPRWKENDGGRFAEAEKLYRKGKDVPRILELLLESIEINPICEKKWAYLGGVLKALNKPEDAMIAYIQALKFNKDNPWSWKGLRDCCRKVGMKLNADGLEWYFRLHGIM